MKIKQAKQIFLPDYVGKGYGTFWRWRGRYRVCKGSRASKKSKTTALWYIVNLMKYPDANLLVVRKVFRTLKDSCFTELKWAINRLGVAEFWEIKESPLEMTYLPTGQKIYFRGLDDPLKVTSITVEHGYLCWIPDGLVNIAVDMAVGEFLTAKKTFSPDSIAGLDLDMAVKQIQTGDTNTVFATGEGSSTPEQRLNSFLNYLLTYGRDQFSCYRKIRW